jgi:hypothetical protein
MTERGSRRRGARSDPRPDRHRHACFDRVVTEPEASLCNLLVPAFAGRCGGREGEGSAPNLATMGPGKGFDVGEPGPAFPMLQQLVEAEAGGTQGSGGVAGEGSGEGEDDRLLALVFETGLAGESPAAEGGPAGDLLRIAKPVAQGQQGAIESVALQVEKPGLVDEAAGLDQAAGADLALGILEPGFLFGEAGFVLFVSAYALGQRTGHGSPRI